MHDPESEVVDVYMLWNLGIYENVFILLFYPLPQLAPEEEKENHCLTGMSEFSQDQELPDKDSQGHISRECIADINSDDKASAVLTVKGGMRRKHHRAWTLTEVVKLVDGVSKFGAGRWSEIKRLSFSSHSYRTSVDLKVRI